MSVDILRVDPVSTGQAPGLREWAVNILSHYSDVPIPGEGRLSLSKGPLPGADRTLDVLAMLKKSQNIDDSIYASAAMNAIFLDAVEGGRSALVERMMRLGVSPDAADSSGTSALVMATLGGQDAIARLLLDAKADASRENRTGETALMIAARDNKVEIMRSLLPVLKAADLDHTNRNRDTALILAVRDGHLECVKMLLGAGAHQTEGLATLAMSKGYTEVVRLLQGKSK
jgi:ankyrin repeat protein